MFVQVADGFRMRLIRNRQAPELTRRPARFSKFRAWKTISRGVGVMGVLSQLCRLEISCPSSWFNLKGNQAVRPVTNGLQKCGMTPFGVFFHACNGLVGALTVYSLQPNHLLRFNAEMGAHAQAPGSFVRDKNVLTL
jgi:hypothetical protein